MECAAYIILPWACRSFWMLAGCPLRTERSSSTIGCNPDAQTRCHRPSIDGWHTLDIKNGLNEWMIEWTNEWTNGQNEQMHGQAGGQTQVHGGSKTDVSSKDFPRVENFSGFGRTPNPSRAKLCVPQIERLSRVERVNKWNNNERV